MKSRPAKFTTWSESSSEGSLIFSFCSSRLNPSTLSLSLSLLTTHTSASTFILSTSPFPQQHCLDTTLLFRYNSYTSPFPSSRDNKRKEHINTSSLFFRFQFSVHLFFSSSSFLQYFIHKAPFIPLPSLHPRGKTHIDKHTTCPTKSGK